MTAVICLNFIMRPTAAIFWFPFGPEILVKMIRTRKNTRFETISNIISCCLVGFVNIFHKKIILVSFLFEVIFEIMNGMFATIRFGVIALGAWFDYAVSGTVSWWEFFKFNFLEKGNADFGVHHPLWYFYSAIPMLLGHLCVFLPVGFFLPKRIKKLSWYLAFYIGVYR